MTTPFFSTPAAKRRLLVILVASFLLHFCVALISSGGIVRDDAESYVLLGKNLAHGAGYVFEVGKMPTAWRAPGYPALLGIVFKLSGDSLTAARVVNAVLWTGTTLCIYSIAVVVLEPSAALLACALAAFYPSFLGFSGLLWSETLFTFLFTAALTAIFKLSLRPRIWLAFAAGALLGASILTRSTAIVVFGVIVLAALMKSLRPLHAAVVIVAALAMVAPWTLRNYGLFGRFVFVESNSTYNLFLGSRPNTPYPFSWQIHDMIEQDPERQRIRALPAPEQYTAYGQAAVREIAANPKRYLLLACTKTFDFWLPDFFIARNVRSGAFGLNFRPAWMAVLALTAGTFLLVALFALVTIARRWRATGVQLAVALLLLYTLPHSLVFGASRFHQPLMPVLLILAAPALLDFFQRRFRPRPA